MRSIKIVLVVVVLGLLFFLTEHLSKRAILSFDPHYELDRAHNRRLSGYTLNASPPDYPYGTYKNDSVILEQRTDPRGFFPGEAIDYTVKDSNTYRVFIGGGSGAMGSGQVYFYDTIHDYPNNLYHYSVTIAGFLKEHLGGLYPDKRIQVINTCLYTRPLHESYLLYLTDLSYLGADLVIQIDGFNDLTSIVTENPYKAREEQFLKHSATSEMMAYKASRWHTVNLIYYKLLKRQIRYAAEDYKVYHPYYASRSDYDERKEVYLDRSEGFFKVIDHYANTLSNDGVDFIFCIQPMLHSDVNKELSDSEKAFARSINFFEVAELDRHIDLGPLTPDPAVSSYYYYDEMLCLKYCWSDFVSSRWDSISVLHGGSFIDLNQEISDLDNSFGFYTDFCHYTEQANRKMAEILVERIVEEGLVK